MFQETYGTGNRDNNYNKVFKDKFKVFLEQFDLNLRV